MPNAPDLPTPNPTSLPIEPGVRPNQLGDALDGKMPIPGRDKPAPTDTKANTAEAAKPPKEPLMDQVKASLEAAVSDADPANKGILTFDPNNFDPKDPKNARIMQIARLRALRGMKLRGNQDKKTYDDVLAAETEEQLKRLKASAADILTQAQNRLEASKVLEAAELSGDEALLTEVRNNLRINGQTREQHIADFVGRQEKARGTAFDIGEKKDAEEQAGLDFDLNAKYEEPKEEKTPSPAAEAKAKTEARLTAEQMEEQKMKEMVNLLLNFTDIEQRLFSKDIGVQTQRLHTQLVLAKIMMEAKGLEIPSSVKKLFVYDSLSEAVGFLTNHKGDSPDGKGEIELSKIWGQGDDASLKVFQDAADPAQNPKNLFDALKGMVDPNKGPTEGWGRVRKKEVEVVGKDGKPKTEIVNDGWDDGIKHDTFLWLKSKFATTGVAVSDIQVEKLVMSGKFSDAFSTLYMADFNNHSDKRSFDRVRKILQTSSAFNEYGLADLFGKDINQGIVSKFISPFFGEKNTKGRKDLDIYMHDMAKALYSRFQTFGEKHGDQVGTWSGLILMLGMMKFSALSEGVFISEEQGQGH